ncbi:MAG: hypothetical protein AAF125_03215, partial [Chloroflexota bacterium]
PPLERLIRMGWDALDTLRNEPITLDKVARDAREAIESARKGILDETSLKGFTFEAPMDNATAANVELELSVGESFIRALDADAVQLLAADLTYLGSLSFGVSGDTQRHVYLRQSTQITVGWANPVHWTRRPNWTIGLSRKLPLDLRVQGGVGDADINLSGLNLQALRVDGNIGNMNITLAESKMAYAANIRGAAGGVALNIPEGANANVSLRGGVGGLAINVAPNAAVQLNLASGVGKTIMTPGFNRTEAAAPMLSNTRVWETENYGTSTQRVLINVADGMVGNVRVRVLESDALTS